MSDRLSKVACYRELARECVKRADLATNEVTRDDFNRMADAYLDRAHTELKRAE
jgi:hypothetical protein